MGRFFAGDAYRGMISRQVEAVKAERERNAERMRDMTLDERIRELASDPETQDVFRPGYR